MSLFRLATVALASTLAIGSAFAYDIELSGYAGGGAADTFNVQVGATSLLNVSAGAILAKFANGSPAAGVSFIGQNARGENGYTFSSQLAGLPVETFTKNATYQSPQYFELANGQTVTGAAGTSSTGFTSAQSELLGRLMQNYGNVVNTDLSGGHDSQARHDGAALQLAVWDILFDSAPGNVSTGAFSVTGALTATQASDVAVANSWLADITTGAHSLAANPALHPANGGEKLASVAWISPPNDGHGAVTHAGTTDLLVLAPLAVPEPSALLLMASGICAIGFVGRRRLRERA
jgi:hypothetical protein